MISYEQGLRMAQWMKSANEEIVALLEPLAVVRGIGVVGELLVPAAAHDAGDEATLGHQVDHRRLLGELDRVLPDGDRVAELHAHIVAADLALAGGAVDPELRQGHLERARTLLGFTGARIFAAKLQDLGCNEEKIAN